MVPVEWVTDEFYRIKMNGKQVLHFTTVILKNVSATTGKVLRNIGLGRNPRIERSSPKTRHSLW